MLAMGIHAFLQQPCRHMEWRLWVGHAGTVGLAEKVQAAVGSVHQPETLWRDVGIPEFDELERLFDPWPIPHYLMAADGLAAVFIYVPGLDVALVITLGHQLFAGSVEEH